jgi:hypothetical protein
MAKQRFAWSDSKGYTIKIFADTDQISYNPFEFETAAWEVTYDAQDAYSPGIVPSRMQVQAVLTTFPFAGSLEQVLRDAEGIFYLELWQGLSKEWAGSISPSACTIEVINGARFLTILAWDGFHKLDLDSSMYSFSGYKSFITQLGDIFTRLDLERLFDGIAVSDTTRRTGNASTKTFDGLYHTGSVHELFYYDSNKTYRTYREIVEEICILFGLRMYQDRGFLVFQDFSRVTESEYSFYDMYGNYQTRRAFTSSQTLPVEAGGTKMYLPALKQVDIVHEYGSTQFAFQSTLRTAEHNEFVATVGFTPVYQLKPGIPLGLYAGDGSTHFDFFDTQMRTVASFPGDYDSSYDIEFRLFLVYGTQSTNGTIWGSDLYLAFTESGRIRAGGSPGIINVVHNINNYHLPLTPVLGNSNVWLYLEVVQTDGDPLGLSKPTIKYDIRLDGTGETQTTYRADNTARLIGQKLDYRTRLGDIPKGTPITQAIQVTGGTNAADFVEVAGGPTQPLLFITANRMAQLRAQPREYYEIGMRGTSRFTHYGYWGTYYYIPISLTYTWDSCQATYAQFALDDLKSSALLVKNPTFELEA